MQRCKCVGWVLILGLVTIMGCKTNEPVTSSASEPGALSAQSAPAPAAAQSDTPIQQPVEGEVGILSTEKTEYDFGIIEPGSKNVGEFILKNTGKGMLEIDKSIKCSCGCTLASLEKYTLNPGETTKMTVNYHAGETPGESSKYCTLKPMPPAKGELRLVIKSNVKRHVTVSPETVTIALKPGGEQSQTLVVESSDDRPFKITRATVTGETFAMDFNSELSATRHEVKVTPDMEKLSNMSSGAFTIFLEHPAVNRVNARYSAQLPFQAQPATIFFRDMTPDVPSQGTITIVSEFGDKVEISEVTTEKGLVKILSKEMKDNSFVITVELAASKDDQTRILRDRVIFTLKNPYQQDIKVPVYGRVKY